MPNQMMRTVQSTESQEFKLDSHPLFAAAQALSLLAYPRLSERRENGPAHQFCLALLADIARVAKSFGNVDRLPNWATMKVETMRGKIQRGTQRLHYRSSALMVIFEAVDREEERSCRENGHPRTFSIRYSQDFRNLKINIPVERIADGPRFRLVGSLPKEDRLPSLRAAIIEHRAAFRQSHSDPQTAYVNILSRHVRPTIPVLGLALIVREALLKKSEEARERNLSATEILMHQPEWASDLPNKVREREGLAKLLRQKAGLKVRQDELLKFA